ncbi:MAG: glycosyltransferase family 2 protein [Aphanizomenon sp.]
MPLVNTALTLKDLPPAPEGKRGWPWTEQTEPLPDKMADGSDWPRISIVTPSYNQGQFIEETIRSVLLQGYPNLEYIIIDGRSNDNSVEIIRKYEPWLAYWVSETDNGQANAVNKGIAHSTGNILNFLNSDDLFLPNTVSITAKIFPKDINSLIVTYGFRLRMTAEGQIFDFDLPPNKINLLTFRIGCWIPSETFFFTRKTFNLLKGFNEELEFAIDYDFYLRSYQIGANFLAIKKFMGVMRFHNTSKSTIMPKVGNNEFFYLRENILGNNLASLSMNLFCDLFFSKLVFHKNRFRKHIWKYLNKKQFKEVCKDSGRRDCQV